MITNTGKNIIAKYLVGQAPAYASYIALGCGPKPISSGTSFDTYKEEFTNKDVLDFEMFRVPIISRGYVTDNGVNKVVLTAELPTEERYEISEVGIYSAGSNPSAGAYDSKMVFSFSQSENWEFHGSASLSQNIPTIQIPLDTLNGLVRDDIIVGSYKINSETKEYDALGTLTPLKAFQTNADNRVFMDSVKRNLRYEKSRMLNNLIMMSGSSGKLNASLVPQTGSSHIHLTGASLNFTKNSPSDLLKLAFSLINKIGGSDIQPDEVRILVEFSSTDEYNSGQWAKLKVKLVNGVDGNFATNRYFVSKSQLQDLTKSDGFSWDSVNTVKIYTTVIKDSVESEDYYIGLDALRLDNLSTINQLYGLTGYTIVRTDNAETIVKIPNTTNYVEFRFGMDVA